jgi:hypothetical protein
MKRNAVRLMLSLMALAPGMLFFSAGAGAIPSQQNPLSAGSQATSGAPDAVQMSELQQAAATDPADGHTEKSELIPDLAANPEGHADPENTEPGTSIPCLHGLSNATPHDDSAAQTLCTDGSGGRQRLSAQFGRHLGAHSGMLGELDGIRVDYRLTGGLTMNGVVGYPVVKTEESFNTTRQVFGLSADTGEMARAWGLNSYIIEQQDNNQEVSRAMGGALRYSRSNRSLLMFVDYDINDESMSALMVSGAWKLPRSTTLSATFDIRNNPIEKRQQKYLQRIMASTDGWQWALPADRIKHFTKDRSYDVTTMALGLSHAFSQRIKLSGSVALLDAWKDAAEASTTGGSTQTSEYFYRVKLTGKDLMFAGNSNKLELRHRVTTSSRKSSATLDSKYKINRRWNVSPKLRAEHRDNVLDKSVQWVTSPAVKMEYRWRELYGFQIEAGGEWKTQQTAGTDKSDASYFVGLGYQAKF